MLRTLSGEWLGTPHWLRTSFPSLLHEATSESLWSGFQVKVEAGEAGHPSQINASSCLKYKAGVWDVSLFCIQIKASDCNFTAFKMQTVRPCHEVTV